MESLLSARRPGRALAIVGEVATVAIAGWAAPAVLRSRLLRGRLTPRLAGQGCGRRVALTFDDGPDPVGTPAVLAVLEQLGCRATFFLLGSQVVRYPSVAGQIAAAGHEVAVHGFTHRSHLTRSWSGVRGDVAAACAAVAEATGRRPGWFRPPYGVPTAASLAAARECELRPVLWTAWGRDWERVSGQQVADTVRRQLRAGDTVLLHDADCATDVQGSWQGTVTALPLIADIVAGLGCDLGPLGEHFDR